MSQARGSASQVLIDFEATYGVDPNSPAGISIPYHFPVDLKQSQDVKPSTVHRGNRNPAQGFYDTKDVKGTLSVPVDILNFGYWLRALLGTPTTGGPVSDTLDNAPAVDKVGDFVGIPITGHSFIAGQSITIDGTTNYDGTYIIASKTTNEIVIPSLYVAETFVGTETCVAAYYTHIFKPAAGIESFLVDAGYTNINQFFKFNGCKLGQMSIDFGGAGNELMAKLSITGAKETQGGTAYDESPTSLALTRFMNRHLSFEEGGSAFAKIKSGTLNIGNDLDEDSFAAAGDSRFDLPEGDAQVNGSFSVFFDDVALYNKAAAGTPSSFKVVLDNGVYSLTFLFPELLYSVETPTIVKGGVYADFKFEGYYASAAEAAAIVATLVNNQASYA